jgi:hypothetical protein
MTFRVLIVCRRNSKGYAGTERGSSKFLKVRTELDYIKTSEESKESVPLTSALLNLPKGKSLGRSKPATNS